MAGWPSSLARATSLGILLKPVEQRIFAVYVQVDEWIGHVSHFVSYSVDRSACQSSWAARRGVVCDVRRIIPQASAEAHAESFKAEPNVKMSDVHLGPDLPSSGCIRGCQTEWYNGPAEI